MARRSLLVLVELVHKDAADRAAPPALVFFPEAAAVPVTRAAIAPAARPLRQPVKPDASARKATHSIAAREALAPPEPVAWRGAADRLGRMEARELRVAAERQEPAVPEPGAWVWIPAPEAARVLAAMTAVRSIRAPAAEPKTAVATDDGDVRWLPRYIPAHERLRFQGQGHRR
jgi:hypothetical protein